MCAHLGSINRRFNKIEKMVDDLQHSKQNLYKEFRRKLIASSNWLPHIYTPSVEKISTSLSKKPFQETKKQIHELTNGQFNNYILLLDAYQKNHTFPCDIDTILKMKKSGKSYRTTLIKNFSWETANNRGNNAFFYLIEKRIESFERPKKTKKGIVKFTRNIALYGPVGFFKDLSFLLFFNNVAAKAISKFYLWMQQTNDINRKLNYLKRYRDPTKSLEESYFMNRQRTTRMDYFTVDDQVFVQEHERLRQMRVQAQKDIKITKQFTASDIARQMRTDEYTYEDFIINLKKNTEMLFNKLVSLDKEADEYSVRMRQEILDDLEGKLFSYHSLTRK